MRIGLSIAVALALALFARARRVLDQEPRRLTRVDVDRLDEREGSGVTQAQVLFGFESYPGTRVRGVRLGRTDSFVESDGSSLRLISTGVRIVPRPDDVLEPTDEEFDAWVFAGSSSGGVWPDLEVWLAEERAR